MLRFAAALLVSLFLCGTARAQYIVPESGWYWNPSFSGSGYNLELQDSTMFLSFFGYNQARQSTFYTISGTYSVATRTVVGDLFSFSNGQCVGCPYNPPTVTAIGTGVVQFTSQSSAIITLPGSNGPVSTPIQRFVFGFDPNLAGRDIGAWFTTIVFSSGLPDSDVVRIRSTSTDSQGRISRGDLYPAGQAIVGFPGTIQGTGYNYGWLISFSATTDAFYAAEFTLNGFRGEYFIVPRGSSISGRGTLTFGARVAGPNTANQVLTLSSANTAEIEAKAAERMAKAKSSEPYSKATLDDLNAMLNRLRVERAKLGN